MKQVFNSGSYKKEKKKLEETSPQIKKKIKTNAEF